MYNKTVFKKQEETEHKWYTFDATDKVLGRAATAIATLLIGKNRPDFTPHIDGGSGVIVINCDKIRVTGKKEEGKIYTTYSGYPGGIKRSAYKDEFEKDPAFVLRHAVRGMLPKSKLGVKMLRRLKIYKGTEHPHVAQQPESLGK